MADLLDHLRRRKEQDSYRKARLDALNRYNFVPPDLPHQHAIGRPWELTGDWLIVGDVHVPETDWEMALAAARIAEINLDKPRRLLIAGDLLDMNAFSSWPHVSLYPSWQEERKSARLLLKTWLNVFDEIRWFVGNHERRLQRLLVEMFEDSDIRSMITDNEKVIFSDFSYCYLNCTNTGRWLIVHPRNHSVNPLTVARRLAEREKANIISFHEHHLGVSWDIGGNFLIVNGGALADDTKMSYTYIDKRLGNTTKKGFVIMKDGYPHVFGEPPMTNWEIWTRKIL